MPSESGVHELSRTRWDAPLLVLVGAGVARTLLAGRSLFLHVNYLVNYAGSLPSGVRAIRLFWIGINGVLFVALTVAVVLAVRNPRSGARVLRGVVLVDLVLFFVVAGKWTDPLIVIRDALVGFTLAVNLVVIASATMVIRRRRGFGETQNAT